MKKTTNKNENKGRQLMQLPIEILLLIIKYMTVFDALSFGATCTFMRNLVRSSNKIRTETKWLTRIDSAEFIRYNHSSLTWLLSASLVLKDTDELIINCNHFEHRVIHGDVLKLIRNFNSVQKLEILNINSSGLGKINKKKTNLHRTLRELTVVVDGSRADTEPRDIIELLTDDKFEVLNKFVYSQNLLKPVTIRNINSPTLQSLTLLNVMILDDENLDTLFREAINVKDCQVFFTNSYNLWASSTTTEKLANNLKNMKNLETLRIRQCLNSKHLSFNQIMQLPKLRSFEIDYVSNIHIFKTLKSISRLNRRCTITLNKYTLWSQFDRPEKNITKIIEKIERKGHTVRMVHPFYN